MSIVGEYSPGGKTLGGILSGIAAVTWAGFIAFYVFVMKVAMGLM